LVALAAFGWARALDRERAQPGSTGHAGQALPVWSWLAIAGLVVAGPLFWSVVRPLPAVPKAISALYQPGKINVIEFADFECPYCRRLQSVLAPLISEYGDRVSFRRLQRPLAQHEFAEAAARAALCAEAQGKGEEMAARLFSMKLSERAIENAAEALRLDPGRYGACVDSEETTATLASHAALLPDEQFQGLPTTYIGRQRILGVATEAALRDAFEQALRPARPSLSGPVYVGIWTALIGLVCVVGARRRSARS
jgi:protein-disulfide isomerase